MLVFIDDSGDPGFKLTKGSTKYFVLSCVIFEDELEAEKTAVAIKQLRRDLKFPDECEFKFSKSRREVRKAFLRTVSKFDFKIRSLVVKKAIVRSSDRIFRREFLTYLRKQLNSRQRRIMKNCKLIDSRSNVLIQMADMVAGSVRRFHNGSKADAKEYRKIIEKQIEDEWNFK